MSQCEVQWERVLWKQQPFEDNFVPDSFLDSLVVNAKVSSYALQELVIDSVAISQQLAALVLLILVFTALLDKTLSLQLLLVIDGILLFAGLAICSWLDSAAFFKTLGRAVLLSCILAMFSPILKTLTSSYSADTIWALTFLFCFLHLMTHDYSFVNDPSNSTS
jgi:phosphatidylinositol glycan class C protein